jgi:hypothetical protein
MPLLTDLIGLGMPPEHASVLSGFTVSSAPSLTSSGTLTAAGTNLATALALTSFLNFVGTTGAGTGVKLPDAPIGTIVVVQNNGANALNVFPHDATGTLNGGTAGAAVTCAAAAGNICIRRSATDWMVYVVAKEA